MIAPVMIAWMLHTAIGGGRQMYDTRLYTHVYNAIVVSTVLQQRQSGIEPTKVAARSAMSREFVTFFEGDMPVVLNTLVTIVGSAATVDHANVQAKLSEKDVRLFQTTSTTCIIPSSS
jgi:hypothetical protein